MFQVTTVLPEPHDAISKIPTIDGLNHEEEKKEDKKESKKDKKKAKKEKKAAGTEEEKKDGVATDD